MSRTSWNARPAVALAAVLTVCGATAAAGEESGTDAAQIVAWIEQLDSDSYFVREEAARKLSTAGADAVAPLAEAAEGRGLETTVRALDILGQLCTSDDVPTLDAAEAVLERLTQSADRSVATRAQAALQPRNMVRRASAIERLSQLGAKTEMDEGQLVKLLLTEDWTGEQADLEQLRWLADLEWLIAEDVALDDEAMRHLGGLQNLLRIELNRTELTDEGVAQLKGLPQLAVLQLANVDLTDAAAEHLQQFASQNTMVALFGTKMTGEAVDELRAARPDLTIDRREGALLGVSGSLHQDGCIIETVRQGTAAFEAGIQLGDVITHFDEQRVGDFVELTAMIARKKPGDQVTLRLRRGASTFDRDVTFGSW